MTNIPLNSNNGLFFNGVIRAEPTARNKIGLKRIDLEVLIRFLNVLSESNSIGITNLQMRTGTNHYACYRYVGFLRKFGFVQTFVDGKKKNVSLTEKGREVIKLLSAV
ncbi:MAG: hypothetical protein ACRD38_00960 [Nitrososphaerales archaeon]